jgi:hypothetical protein
MCRLFMIFLLVLMPLQLSWAAMASYCQHESGQAAKHFGHHAHKHVTSQTDVDDDSSSPLSGKPHADCASCHLSPVGIVLPSSLTVAPQLASIPLQEPPSFPHSAFFEGPERPQWIFAV